MMTIFNMLEIDAQPRTDRKRVLARFDAVVGSVRLFACAIVQQLDRTLVAELPGRAQTVRIVDPAIERKFQEAALAAYHTITKGGRHAA
jgi:hypothetical protein